MLKEKIIDKALNAGDSIETERSRCLRMRFNQNSCIRCTEQCRSNAISIEEDVSIDFRLCSECMLCVSACPADCFDIKSFDFYSALARLRKIRNSVPVPVLGCNMKRDIQAHVKTPCLGFMSEAHILALSVFMDTGLHINMTGCAECKNRFIAGEIEERFKHIKANNFNLSGNIILITDKKNLNYSDVGYDRRVFFSALKNLTFLRAAELFENDDAIMASQSYSEKKVPVKRELLNRILSYKKADNARLLENYFYTVHASEDCNNCFACIGMCPTGALKIETSGDNRELTFSTHLCNGCGLCRDFCMAGAVNIKNRFSGDNPFEFVSAKKELLCEA